MIGDDMYEIKTCHLIICLGVFDNQQRGGFRGYWWFWVHS